MKKQLIYLCIISAIIVVSGCTKANISEITFDDFTCTIKTKNIQFQEISGVNAYKTYIYAQQTGFSDSIVIAKDKIDSAISLEKIVNTNIKKIETKFKGFTAKKISSIKIKCQDEQTLTGYTVSFSFDSITPSKTIYMNQLFVAQNDTLYTISSATERKTATQSIREALRKIHCINQ